MFPFTLLIISLFMCCYLLKESFSTKDFTDLPYSFANFSKYDIASSSSSADTDAGSGVGSDLN